METAQSSSRSTAASVRRERRTSVDRGHAEVRPCPRSCVRTHARTHDRAYYLKIREVRAYLSGRGEAGGALHLSQQYLSQWPVSDQLGGHVQRPHRAPQEPHGLRCREPAYCGGRPGHSGHPSVVVRGDSAQGRRGGGVRSALRRHLHRLYGPELRRGRPEGIMGRVPTLAERRRPYPRVEQRHRLDPQALQGVPVRGGRSAADHQLPGRGRRTADSRGVTCRDQEGYGRTPLWQPV